MMEHKHQLSCHDMLEKLNAYIDGELDADQCAAIESHLSTCENCRIIYNTVKKTIQIYQSNGKETTLPEDTRHRLYKRIDHIDDENDK